jgi:hypothetical protein
MSIRVPLIIINGNQNLGMTKMKKKRKKALTKGWMLACELNISFEFCVWNNSLGSIRVLFRLA